MLTGKSPVEHGHWNLFYYDPEGSPFRWLRRFGFVPDTILNHRVTRKGLQQLGRRVLGLGPLFDCYVSPRLLPWFNWVEKRNVYEPQGIRGAASIFDSLAGAGVPYRMYSYHQFNDAKILSLARRDIEAGRATFFFLYLCEVDAFLHHHVEDDAPLKEKLAGYETALRELLATARARDPRVAQCLVDRPEDHVVRACLLRQPGSLDRMNAAADDQTFRPLRERRHRLRQVHAI